MNKRIDWIDNLKGVGIVLVVWAHMNLPFAAEQFIYSFHMPLFFMVSGFLYKKKRVDVPFLKKKLIGLIVPYLVFAIPSFFVGIAMNEGIKKSILDFFFIKGYVSWNSPLWFLLILFAVSIIYPLLNTVISEHVIGAVSLILGYFVANTDTNFLGYEKIVFGLAFYYLGHQLKYLMVSNTYEKFKYPILGVSFAMNIVFGMILNPRISFYWNTVGNYFYFLIAALSGTIVMFILISTLPKMPKFFKFYGLNSLVVMGTHYFFRFSFLLIARKLGMELITEISLIGSILQTLIILIGELPIIFVYNKTVPAIIYRAEQSRAEQSRVK